MAAPDKPISSLSLPIPSHSSNQQLHQPTRFPRRRAGGGSSGTEADTPTPARRQAVPTTPEDTLDWNLFGPIGAFWNISSTGDTETFAGFLLFKFMRSNLFPRTPACPETVLTYSSDCHILIRSLRSNFQTQRSPGRNVLHYPWGWLVRARIHQGLFSSPRRVEEEEVAAAEMSDLEVACTVTSPHGRSESDHRETWWPPLVPRDILQCCDLKFPWRSRKVWKELWSWLVHLFPSSGDSGINPPLPHPLVWHLVQIRSNHVVLGLCNIV